MVGRACTTIFISHPMLHICRLFCYRKGLQTAGATAWYAADGVVDAEYDGYGILELVALYPCLPPFCLLMINRILNPSTYIKHVGP